ncbi:unnamed protein product [Rotaria socialis]
MSKGLQKLLLMMIQNILTYFIKISSYLTYSRILKSILKNLLVERFSETILSELVRYMKLIQYLMLNEC